MSPLRSSRAGLERGLRGLVQVLEALAEARFVDAESLLCRPESNICKVAILTDQTCRLW